MCLRKTLTEGYDYTVQRGSFAEQTRRELDYVVIQITYPRARPLVPDVPPGVPPPTSMEYVESYLPYLMTSQKKEGEEYTYGQYLEKQIQEVIKMHKGSRKHYTNQAFMTVGGPETISFPDPPCLRSIDTKVYDGRLHFFVYFRSWDLWAGFPSNLAALQLLKEYMSSEIGVEDGELVATSKGLHLYKYAWEQARIAAGMRWLKIAQLSLFQQDGS